MAYTLIRKFQIEAAHRLPHLPEGHKCRRLHGHSFRIEVVIRGALDPQIGWVIDYADIDEVFQDVHDALDHRFLNEIDGLENPTSEILARWIFDRMAPRLAGLAEVRISETCQESCIYTKD